MFRHSLAIVLVLVIGLQSATLGYAASIGLHHGAPGATVEPCPLHATLNLSGHAHGQSHHAAHSIPASCLAHCAGMAAIPPSSPSLVVSTVKMPVDPLVVTSAPSERPPPSLRPPIS